MEQYNNINKFIEIIENQIRYKKARESASEEIENHIFDLKNKYISSGFEEEIAEIKAIEQMGDPVDIGVKLDRIHRPKINLAMILIVCIMTTIGICILYASSISFENTEFYLKQQIIFAVIGIGVMIVTYFIDYTILGKYPILITSLIIIYCIFQINFAAGGGIIFVTRVNGTFTSIYFCSVLFAPVLAGILYRLRGSGVKGVVVFGMICFVCILLVSNQNITGGAQLTITALVILTAVIIKGWFGENKRIQLLVVYIPIAMITFVSIIYILTNDRLCARIFPSVEEAGGASYFVLLTRNIISNSKLFGMGTITFVENMTLNDLSFDAMPHSEYALTYIIGKYGLAAGILIIFIFGLLVYVLFKSVIRQKNQLGFVVSLSCATMILLQGVIFILGNLGFVLFNPVSLPFIGYGGLGIMTNMCILGLCLSVHSCGSYEKYNVPNRSVSNNPVFFEISNGKIIINFNCIIMGKK